MLFFIDTASHPLEHSLDSGFFFENITLGTLGLAILWPVCKFSCVLQSLSCFVIVFSNCVRGVISDNSDGRNGRNTEERREPGAAE